MLCGWAQKGGLGLEEPSPVAFRPYQGAPDTVGLPVTDRYAQLASYGDPDGIPAWMQYLDQSLYPVNAPQELTVPWRKKLTKAQVGQVRKD